MTASLPCRYVCCWIGTFVGRLRWVVATVALFLALLPSASGAPLAPAAPGGSSIPPTAATESTLSARTHFRHGEVHYAAGRYHDALAAYRAGYRTQPLPGFLVNIAQCLRRMGDLHGARAAYGRFVLVAPDSPLVPEVRGLIEEIDRLISETAAANRSSGRNVGGGAKPATVGPGTVGVDGFTAAAPTATLVPDLDSAPVRLPLSIGVALPPGARDGALAITGARGTDLGAHLPKDVHAAEAPGRPIDRSPASDGAAEGTAIPSTSRLGWWLWSSLATVGISAAALAAGLSSPSVIHQGSLGTLRR